MPNEKPARTQMRIVRGDTLRDLFSYDVGPTEAEAVPVSVAAESWRFTVRHGKTDAVLLALTSSPGGGITLDADGVIGRVRTFAPGSVTAAFPVTVGRCDPTPHRFDYERTDVAGVVETFWIGDFHVEEGQSR